MIRSTFAGFTTAQLAMQASQKSLDITGQNIANINTTGYTRQRLDIVSLNTQNGSFYSSKTSTNVGYGVDITGVSQIRDPYLDIQYRNQISKVGAADSKQSALDLVNNIFDETTRDAIKIGLSNLSSNLSQLSNPTNVSNQIFDNTVRSSSQILVNYFNQNAAALADAENQLISSLADTDIPAVNSILTEITKLNETIKNSQVLGNTALELIDARNMMLDDLASYLPIEVKYTTQHFSGGTSVDILNVSFRDTNGNSHSLIADNKHGEFAIDANNIPIKLTITDTDGTQSGDLAKLIGGGTFKGSLDMLNEAGAFSGDDTTGIGYYRQSFDSLVNAFASTFNTLNIDSDGNPHPLFVTTDGSTSFTASNIKISDDWINGTTRITTSTKENAGTTDNDNVLNMISALTDSRSFTSNDGSVALFKGNFQEFYINMETIMGIDSQSNTTLLKNSISVIDEISSARDTVSGVSLNEEGINLLHYQQSYTAAARLMTTLNDVLDVLLNM
jgi:flagellar hook-associated protein 1